MTLNYYDVVAWRLLFLVFMTWLLVVFLPGHKRGAITLGPRDVDSCCVGPSAQPDASCCAAKHPSKPGEPTPTQKANCAVCHWAAGLLTTPPFVVDLSHAQRAFERARLYQAQVQRIACRLNQYGRDPPAGRRGSIVV